MPNQQERTKQPNQGVVKQQVENTQKPNQDQQNVEQKIQANQAKLIENNAQDTVYIPAKHRDPEATTSSFGALTHILKASLGAGILAMPLAYKNAGLLVGLIGTVFIGIICCYTIHLLVKVSQSLCVQLRSPGLTYGDTFYYVLTNDPKTNKYARFGKELVDWGLAVTHAGACCIYVIIIAETFFQMVPHFGGPRWSVKLYCLLTLVILIPLTQIRSLKYLVPLSTTANMVWITAICISIGYCLIDTPSIASRNLSAPITGLPNFISTCLFAMECIGVVMPVENEMADPHKFLGCPGVLNVGMCIVTVLFSFVGFMGYLKYGETVEGSLTLNLPEDQILAQIAKLLVAWVMLLSFALIYYIPVDIIWRKITPRIAEEKKNMTLAVVRLVGTLFLVGLAAALPSVMLFIGLIGAFCLSVMGLLIPVIIDAVYRLNKDYKMVSLPMARNLFIGLFALIAMTTGVFFAILDIL